MDSDSGDDEAGVVRDSDDDDDDDFRVVPARPALPEVKDVDGFGEDPESPSKNDGGSSKKEEDCEDAKNEDAENEDAENEDAKNEDAKNEDAKNEDVENEKNEPHSEDFDSDEDEDDVPVEKIAARREARAAKLDPELLLREAAPEVVAPEIAALRQHWQLAVVLDFFSVFRTEFLERPFDAADLESALVDPCADPTLWGFIVSLQVELLNGCGFRVEHGELFRRRKRRHADKDHGLMIRDNSWAWVTNRVICEWWRTLTGKRSSEASKPPFAPPTRQRGAEGEDKAPRNKSKPFNAFAKAERSTIKAEHPHIAKKEVDLRLAVRWRRLSDDERREYDPSYDPESVDENEFTERWYADEMTPSQRLMTLWGLCELRLMIGLDHLGPHDVGYEAGWKEPPGKFRPTPIGTDAEGNEYWLRTDTLYRSGAPTYRSMDSVDVPLPVEPPPYYNKDSGTWKDQDEEDYTQLPCMQCGRMQYHEREIEHKFLLCDVCVNGGHARCMGVSVIPGGDTAWNCPVCDGQARIKAAKEAAAEMELKKLQESEREKAEKERAERERVEREKAEKERAERERVEREKAERENAAARRIQTSVRAWLRGKAEAKRLERKKAEKAAAERIQASWRAFMSRKAETENAERAKLEHVEIGAEEVVENPSTRNVPDVIDLTAEEDEDEHQRLIGESQAHIQQQQQDGRWKMEKMEDYRWKRNPANPETYTADPGVCDMSFTEVKHEHEKEFWQALFQFNTHVLRGTGLL